MRKLSKKVLFKKNLSRSSNADVVYDYDYNISPEKWASNYKRDYDRQLEEQSKPEYWAKKYQEKK